MRIWYVPIGASRSAYEAKCDGPSRAHLRPYRFLLGVIVERGAAQIAADSGSRLRRRPERDECRSTHRGALAPPLEKIFETTNAWRRQKDDVSNGVIGTLPG
jgi:hypothetical protein